MEPSIGGNRRDGRQSARFQQPAVKTLYALTDVYFRRPARSEFEFACIGNIVALVPGTPFFHQRRRALPMNRFDQIQQVEQTDSVSQTAPDVECLSGKGMNI